MIKRDEITGDNVVTITRFKEDRYIIESLLHNEPNGVGIQGIIRNVEFFTTGAEFSEPLILNKGKVTSRLRKLESLGLVHHKTSSSKYLWYVGKAGATLKPIELPQDPIDVKSATALKDLVKLNQEFLTNKVLTDIVTDTATNLVSLEDTEPKQEAVIEGITITENDILPFNNTIVTKVVAPKTPEQLALQQAIIKSKLDMKIVSEPKETPTFYFVRYKLTRADGEVANRSTVMPMPQQIKSNRDLETLKDLILKSVKTSQIVCKIDIIYLSKT